MPGADASRNVVRVMHVQLTNELVAMTALLRTRPRGTTWNDIAADVLEHQSAVAVWNLRADASLVADPKHEAALVDAADEVRRWRDGGLDVVTVLDPDYPERLLGVHQAPPFLFWRGDLRRHDRAVSVVGSRSASARGIAMASSIARALADAGVTVMSGLASGVDAAAHRAALDRGARTVGVIGTGILGSYPTANRELQKEVGERGLLISQFWPDAAPTRHSFPMRNATMSGYGLATVVVEASEHSGTRGQARMAVEHGRAVILTDVVVDATLWARELVGRPDVHVAHGVDDVVGIVEGLSDPIDELELLDRLSLNA